jgi:hypothetical protein
LPPSRSPGPRSFRHVGEPSLHLTAEWFGRTDHGRAATQATDALTVRNELKPMGRLIRNLRALDKRSTFQRSRLDRPTLWGPSPQRPSTMTSQGTAHGRFQRAIHRRHVQAAEMAAREMGGLSLADALLLCELLAKADPSRYERAALRWLQRFINERSPPLTEVSLAASALAELRHGRRNVGVEALKRLLRRG